MKRAGFTKKSKFNNVLTKKKGIVYHSKAEADYSEILEQMKKAGLIKSIDRQVSYKLPNFNSKRSLEYRADFVITAASGKVHVAEVKGYMTPEAKIKYAYVQHVYGIVINIVSTTGLRKFRTDFII